MSVDQSAPPVTPLSRALGTIPSGVFIITSGAGPDAIGTMVSFVQQVAFDPPTVVIAFKKGRAMADVLEPGHRFAVNICRAGDKALLHRFAKATQSGADVSEGLSTRVLASGSVILLDAAAYIECEAVKTVDIGADYELLVAVAKSGEVLSAGKPDPMIHVRHDGLRY